MLVEDADRYGISQLHQLRGRIGRGAARLGVPAVRAQGVARGCARWPTTRDGFELAEIDLELRGEGEMLGARQSGLQAFRFARLPEDVALLTAARRRASDMLADDPELAAPEHALLEDALARAFGAEAQEPIPA